MTVTNNPVYPKQRLWILLCAVIAVILTGLWYAATKHSSTTSSSTEPPNPSPAKTSRPTVGGSITNIYAHNLRLHQGPNFRVYVQWLRGQLQPSRKGQNPSFDDPDSFRINVTNGVIRANLGDICNYLNARSAKAPLRQIWITGVDDQVKITGKFHKLVTLPVELNGSIKASGGHTIQMHINKINVLKLPLKGLLGGFHITLADLMGSGSLPGLKVVDNDIYFDSEQLLPAPHIQGSLTKVSLKSPDIEAVYGDVAKDVERVEQWRNFLRLRDGTLDFGKLTMNHVDLIMVDISQDPWFDLDLANYQAQLVNGYTRMTPQAGLQIFMPDVSDLKHDRTENISIEWLKNRNLAPPAEVLPKQ